ncbi:MAG: hypothetical protein QOI80_492, partial [Solirubrobacteraceae bacterium]|nr:hypothetical protein [Solirubrobacteraceae bacterium]
NFPTGAAVTPDGRFLWVVDSGHGINDVRIVRLADGVVMQLLPMPGAFGGIAIAPDGRTAWVSGSPAGALAGSDKGTSGDVVHVFAIDPATGAATEQEPIPLPASNGGTGQIQSLPPTDYLYPAGVAVSPDGKYLGVGLQQADKAAIVSVADGSVTTVAVGRYPTNVIFDRTGRLWVANLYDGSLSVIDPASASVTATVTGLGGERGDRNSHPEGMALDPDHDRLYVAVAQRDTLAVVDTKALAVKKLIAIGRGEGVLGVVPADVAVDRDDIYVANANEDTVAVIARRNRPTRKGLPTRRRTVYVVRHKRLRKRRACGGPTKRQAKRYLRAKRHHRRAKKLPRVRRCSGAPAGYIPGLKRFAVIGKIPTAAYPATVEARPGGGLIWIAAKGFGSGANPLYYYGGGQEPGGVIVTPVYGTYVMDALNGIVGRTKVLGDHDVRRRTAKAEAQAVPVNFTAPPDGTPVRPGGPIQHVFLIVRENRTYDQVFGSDPRGDGNPSLELFDDNGVPGPTGGVTPNAHALTRTFPLLDHVYSDAEVSVDGHLITTGGFANDYVQKATAQNYSRPGKSYDFGIAPVTFGPNEFMFDQAVRQSISFSNYGEEAAGWAPFGADGRPTYDQVVANTNVVYPGPVQIGCLAGPANPASCFQDSGVVGGTGTANTATSRVNIFNAQFTSQLANGGVPAFSYLVVPNDHTNGTTSGAYSAKALIADNDLALGQIVEIISHSSIWDSSAIFVEEDDSQDGADHVDAHRQPAFVISPWTKGAVEVPTRYDQYSIMATIERILGLNPLSTNDALATPMYDAFVSGPGAQPNVEGTRYEAIEPAQPINETNARDAPLADLSAAMPFDSLDLVPQAVSDAILYAAVHGSLAGFTGPGPNASRAEHRRAIGALRAVATGRSARAWLIRHGGEADDEEDERGGASPRVHRLSEAVLDRAATQARRALAAIEH